MCPKCGHDLYIDRVTPDGKYIYICMNPKCSNYGKAIALTGESYEATIKPKGNKEKE